MNFGIIILLATLAFCEADVAHLQRTYLPPARTVAFEQNGFNGRLTQTAPARNFYSPVGASYTSTNTAYRSDFSVPVKFSQNFAPAQISAPSRQYLAPEVETFEPIRVQQSYTAPNFASTNTAYRSGFITPAKYTQNSAASTGFAFKQFGNAQLSTPSRQYLTPEVETFEPITVQQSYSAPVITYSSPAESSAYTGATTEFGTKYATNGGYAY